MNSLLSAVIAVAATSLLLLFREFVLSLGKKEEGYPQDSN